MKNKHFNQPPKIEVYSSVEISPFGFQCLVQCYSVASLLRVGSEAWSLRRQQQKQWEPSPWIVVGTGKPTRRANPIEDKPLDHCLLDAGGILDMVEEAVVVGTRPGNRGVQLISLQSYKGSLNEKNPERGRLPFDLSLARSK